MRRHDAGALHGVWDALAVKKGDEGFTFAKFGDGLFGVEGRVGAEGFGNGFNIFYSFGSKCAQGMLNAVVKLVKNLFR